MHEITAYWEGDMQFTSTNPSGNSFFIDTTPENGGENNGMHPKAYAFCFGRMYWLGCIGAA